MGILGICLILLVASGLLCYFVFDDWSLFIIICAICLLVGLPLSLSLKGDYVSEHVVEEIKIASLSNLDEYNNNAKYISRKHGENITYIRLIKDLNGVDSWEVCSLPRTAVIVIEQDESVVDPTLYIYESGFVPNFWTFSIGQMDRTYVFRLPKISDYPIYESAE